VLLPSAAAAAAQGDREMDGYWFCYSQPDQDPIYVTPVWDARVIQDLITIEFRKVLAAKYNYKGLVSCGAASKAFAQNTFAKTEADHQQQIAVWQKSGRKIVQTGWTSAQPPIGPPAANWSACGATIVANGGSPYAGPFETYVTAAFDAGSASQGDQEAAFTTFLKTKYAIATTDLHPQCTMMGDEAGAQRAIKIWTDNGSRRGKVIETGWKMGG
jgi:hypothetical protein